MVCHNYFMHKFQERWWDTFSTCQIIKMQHGAATLHTNYRPIKFSIFPLLQLLPQQPVSADGPSHTLWRKWEHFTFAWSVPLPPLLDLPSKIVAQLVKESACNEGDLGLIPGLGRSPGEGRGYPLRYSGLQNSMDCIVHRVAKSRA